MTSTYSFEPQDDSLHNANDDELGGIAIIGMAGRFPGANNLDEFWENLKNGVNSIVDIPDNELNLSPSDRAVMAHNPNYVKKAATVKDADLFDAHFFGIFPKEAQVMDPQHRLFLECSWQALEDAGYDPETYAGAIGVYAGCYMDSYILSSLASHPEFLSSLANTFHGGSLQTELGNDKDYLATRVSFKLNLRGPSMTIQTACSTSLVAIAQACQNLQGYQCDMALAGGATLKFPQNRGYLYEEDGMVAPDGRCRTFDAQARGTVFGDGIGVVLLKRLEDAVADGDDIYGVIKGWGLNNDGGAKVGYTAPSVDGQAEAIALAQAVANVNADTITYIEAHGTGTPLGDPIEIDALTKAFRQTTEKKQFCAIGSVKTNIGHLDIAAGVAGLIKTTLALRHKQIPPTLHFETPNPNIDFANSPFYVNTELTPWAAGSSRRRAGISSFGVGGTNAHVVVEEAPPQVSSASAQGQHLLILSAKSAAALDAMSDNLRHHMQRHTEQDIADIAYTLQMGRHAFSHRRIFSVNDTTNAIQLLNSADTRRIFSGQATQQDPPVVFMFPGQGSQHINMGRDLYEHEELFRTQMDRCFALLQPHLGFNLRDILYPEAANLEQAQAQINQTMVAQPAIFAISYSLAQLWISRGVRPSAMIGHSVGEFVAACLADVFSLEDALMLVTERGRLMQALPSGSMLAVRLAEAELRPQLPSELEIATINGPALCAVSGPTPHIEELQKQLEAQEVVCRPLHTSHAFHSSMMDPAVEPFAQIVRGINLQPAQLPIVSTVSGSWLTDAESTSPIYWAEHLRKTVRFADGIGALVEDASRILLEIGPGQTLGTLARQHPETRAEQVILSTSPHVQQNNSAFEHYIQTLGRVWLSGVQVDWSTLYAGEQRQRLHLPTYPFERKRYWFDQVKFKSVHQPLNAVDAPNNGASTPSHFSATAQTDKGVNLSTPYTNGSNGHHSHEPDYFDVSGKALSTPNGNDHVHLNGHTNPHTVVNAAEQSSVYPDHGDTEMMHRIIQQQLNLMQQQLTIWRVNQQNS